MKVVLLGPQRRPTLDAVLMRLELTDTPIATVTAGWQEREPDDAELSRLSGSTSHNLTLHARWLDVLERDPGFAAAERRLRVLLAELTTLYRVRLDHAMTAVYQVQRHDGVAPLREQALTDAIAAVRQLDAEHLRRVTQIYQEFYGTWPPHERAAIAEHRAAVGNLLERCGALVVAGGHVGVLTGVLHLFNVAAAVGPKPVVAWSAGAMALTERVVLFADRAPDGPGHAEVHDRGLSLVPGVVALPHARARLRLGEEERMAVLARRLSPARCLLLEAGSEVHLDIGHGPPALPDGARVLDPSGVVSVAA